VTLALCITHAWKLSSTTIILSVWLYSGTIVGLDLSKLLATLLLKVVWCLGVPVENLQYPQLYQLLITAKKLNYLSKAYPLQTPSWVETSSLLLISFALHFVVSPGKLSFLSHLSQSGLEMGCPEAPILIATAKLTLETETAVLTTWGPHAYSGEMYEEWICSIEDIPYCLSYQH
jgi:hypothetical protein